MVINIVTESHVVGLNTGDICYAAISSSNDMNMKDERYALLSKFILRIITGKFEQYTGNSAPIPVHWQIQGGVLPARAPL